jgi:hypothetical protein
MQPRWPASIAAHLLPLMMGIAVTLVIRGYQYGGGNHSVYLIAPLREVHPELLANDWWTNKTLQYHVAFTKLTAALMKLGIERPAFAALYLALVVLMHVGWLRLVLLLGFDARVYLFSVLLYYLSAGGTGLGSYQFLQDSSFLPGNIANVAMLWGLVCWIAGKTWPAAIWLAIASLFHLNHAIVSLGFWGLAIALLSLSRTRQWMWIAGSAQTRADFGELSRAGEGRGEGSSFLSSQGLPSPQPSSTGVFHTSANDANHRQWERGQGVALIGGFVLIMLLSLPNLIPAARLALTSEPKLPLSEFVQLYVKLRHPHHYDPISWPLALWVSFLWPIPLAYLAWRRMGDRQTARRAALVVVYLCALMTAALSFAGVLFISEPLIQMSLFRFSIYVKLLSCVGAAAVLLDSRWIERPAARWMLLGLPLLALVGLIVVRFGQSGAASVFVRENLTPLLLFILLLAAGVAYVTGRSAARPAWRIAFIVLLIGVMLAAWWNWLGLRISTNDRSDVDYLAMCSWVRQNTPNDAIFLVPPNEQLFRFHARRAIVVNFKGVPQLSSELGEWRRRLELVLDVPLTQLTRRFDQTHADIARRYDALPADHLADAARVYGARYIVTSRPIEGVGQCVFENHSCRLYDLSR